MLSIIKNFTGHWSQSNCDMLNARMFPDLRAEKLNEQLEQKSGNQEFCGMDQTPKKYFTDPHEDLQCNW